MQQFVGSLPKPQSIVTIGEWMGPPLPLAVRRHSSRRRAAARSEQLVCNQFALFIAPDKDLEHRAAVDVDELQRTGPASEKRSVDKIDRSASRNAQVAA